MNFPKSLHDDLKTDEETLIRESLLRSSSGMYKSLRSSGKAFNNLIGKKRGEIKRDVERDNELKDIIH